MSDIDRQTMSYQVTTTLLIGANNMSCRPYINDTEQSFLVDILSKPPFNTMLTPMMLLRKLVPNTKDTGNRQTDRAVAHAMDSLGIPLAVTEYVMNEPIVPKGGMNYDPNNFDDEAFLAATAISPGTLGVLKESGMTAAELAALYGL